MVPPSDPLAPALRSCKLCPACGNSFIAISMEPWGTTEPNVIFYEESCHDHQRPDRRPLPYDPCPENTLLITRNISRPSRAMTFSPSWKPSGARCCSCSPDAPRPTAISATPPRSGAVKELLGHICDAERIFELPRPAHLSRGYHADRQLRRKRLRPQLPALASPRSRT
jgi:hypothetical protein